MTTNEAKRVLGKYGKELNDIEVDQLVNQLYLLADIITEQVKADVSNKQLGVIDSQNKERQNENRS